MTEGETSKQRLEGRVAEILNEREVAINLGSEEGVAPEMRFAILSGHPYVIKDPETGDELGEVDRPKVRVKVSLVKDRFCLARTYETYSVNIGGTGAGIGEAELAVLVVGAARTAADVDLVVVVLSGALV